MASYLDFRYNAQFQPGSVQLPSSFGPPNMAQMFQSGIAGLADPIVAGLEKRQNAAETAQARADMMQGLKTLFGSGTTADPATTGSTTTPRPAGVPTPTGAPAPGGFYSKLYGNPSASAGSPAGDDPGGPHASGTTTVSANTLDAARQAIASVESGGSRNPYSAVGPATRTGDRAYGFAQVMGNNVGPWTEQYFGQRLSPQEFLRNPAAQEAVFRGRFGEYLERTGNVRDAASLWFTGRPYAQAAAAGANDGYNSVQQYVAKVERALGTQAPAPSGAPQTAFSPTVAPAATPAAQAAVVAPQAPLPTAEALPAGHAQVQRKYEPLIFQALNRGDNGEVARLSAQRDAEMQAARGALGTGRVTEAPAAAARTRMAGLDPGVGVGGGSVSPPLPGLDLGGAVPSIGGQGTAEPPIPVVAARPIAPPAVSEPSVYSSTPLVTPPMMERPPVPMVAAATPPPAGGTTGATVPPASPTPVVPPPPAPPPRAVPTTVEPPIPPPPVRVAQAAGLPPAVGIPQNRGIDLRAAELLLRNAKTPGEVNAIGARIIESYRAQQQGAGDRFTLQHDANGNWFRVDKMTGAVTPLGAGGSAKASETVEVETSGGKQRFQWNPQTQRYDIPVGPAGPASAVPSKEVREAERQLHNDFEGKQTIKDYRGLEQGVQGLKGAFTEGSATSDQLAIIQVFKALDPTSTVTGGESATFRNASGVPEQLRALWNRGIGEGGQFSPALRAEIYNTVQRIQQQRLHQVEQIAKADRNRAKAYGLDPERVITIEPFKFERAKPEQFPDYAKPEGGATPGTPAGPPAPPPGAFGSEGNPVPIPGNTADAARTLRALPSGTWFEIVGPDGKPRRDRKK